MRWVAVIDQGLGTRAADGAAVVQRPIEVRGERNAFLDLFRSVLELGQRRIYLGARHVFRRRTLEIQRADAVRTRFQQVGQLARLRGVRAASFEPRYAVDQDAPLSSKCSPCFFIALIFRAVSQG